MSIEAAEQCGILSLAAVAEPVPLDRLLGERDWRAAAGVLRRGGRCRRSRCRAEGGQDAPAHGIDVLIGPEGGFAEDERAMLLRQPRTLRLSLGPRILRADTAAVAALALVQAALGDWTAARIANGRQSIATQVVKPLPRSLSKPSSGHAKGLRQID